MENGRREPPPPDDRDAADDAGREEAAMAGFQPEMNDSVPVAPELSDESPSEPDVLPSVDELVRQVPAEARALLEELFRANFTTVRRVPPSALKSADAPGASGD